MNDSVCSLIWVAAWKMLMIRPTITATRGSGAASTSDTWIAWLPIDMMVSGVMVRLGALGIKTLRQRADEQLPAVGQHEQHQLEGQGDAGGRHHHHAHRHQHARDH